MKSKTLMLALFAGIANTPVAADDTLSTVEVSENRGIKSYDTFSQPQSFQNNTHEGATYGVDYRVAF